MSKKKFADGTQSQALGTAIIVLVMLLLVSLVLYWMYTVELLILPEPIAKLLGISNTGNGDMPWDLGELSEIVRDERHPDVETLTLDLTLENLHAAFLTEEQADGVYIYGRICYYDDGDDIGRRVVLRKNGEKFRADIYGNDDSMRVETVKICNGTSVYIRDSQSGSYRSLPLGMFTPESEAGIPSIAQIIEAVEQFPIPEEEPSDETVEPTDTTVPTDTAESEPSEYTDCELKLVKTTEGSVYYVKFTYADLGIDEEYYVALDHGIVLSAKTLKDGRPIYSYETLSFSTEPDAWQDDRYYSVRG